MPEFTVRHYSTIDMGMAELEYPYTGRGLFGDRVLGSYM